ncbi:MAG: CBS domain-containing protein [Desulfobacterota bacterium]|jgi:acetoin utilization protein AcuB|nr:CBS domain-containing protein [Thermodesulfobacteriota bacterium]
MFIQRSMTRKVITIHPEAGVIEARDLLQQHKIHSLPVVGLEGTLIGIVTDRDVRSALPATILSEAELGQLKERVAQLKVKDIMTTQVVTLSPNNTLEDALLLMQQIHVGALPVIDRDRKILGIIAFRDILRGFAEVLGIDEPGTLLCILADDRQGQMKRIVDAITEEKIRFGSVLVARGWEKGKRAFFPYLFTHNIVGIKKKLEGLGFTLINPIEMYLEPLPPA